MTSVIKYNPAKAPSLDNPILITPIRTTVDFKTLHLQLEPTPPQNE